MASNSYELVLKIAANLDKSYSKSVSVAGKALFAMGEQMEKAAEQAVTLDKVIKSRKSAATLAKQYNAARANLAKLSNEVKGYKQPSKALLAELKAAQIETAKYKRQMDDAVKSLVQQEQAAKTAGMRIDDLSAAYNNASRNAEKYVTKATSVSKGLELGADIQQSAENMRNFGVRNALEGAAVVRVLYEPIANSMEFETKTKELQKYTDSAQAVMDANLRLSQTTSVAYSDMADIQAAALQAGILNPDNVKQIEQYTDVVSKAVLAFDMTGEAVGDKFAQIQATITGSMDATVKMFDQVNAVSNATNASAADLLEVISRSGGLVKNFTSLGDAQLVALSSAFRAVSSDASSAATAQSAFIRALALGKGATKTQLEGYDYLGINAQKLAVALNNGPDSAEKALSAVLGQLSKVSKAERAAVLSKIFGGDQGTLNAVASIMDQYETLIAKPMGIVSQDNTGSMAAEAAVQMDTVANQQQILANNFKALNVILGQQMLPLWNTLLGMAVDALQWVVDFSKQNSGFVKGLLMTVAGFGALKIALGGASYLLASFVVGPIGKGITAFNTLRKILLVANGTITSTSTCLNVAAKGFNILKWAASGLFAILRTNPFALIISIIGALIAIGIKLYKNWDTIKEKFPTVAAVVEGVIGAIGAKINAFKQICSGIIEFLTGVFTLDWQKAWSGLRNILAGMFDMLPDLIKAPINKMTSMISGAWDSVKNKVKGWFGFGDKQLDIQIKTAAGQNTVSDVPQLARGGIVTSPTLSLIGEGTEPEAIMPLSKLNAFLHNFGGVGSSGSSSSPVTITFSPVINITGTASADPYAQVEKALNVGAINLKRELDKYFAERERLGYE